MSNSIVLVGNSEEISRAARVTSLFFPLNESPNPIQGNLFRMIVKMPEALDTHQHTLRKNALLAALKKMGGNLRIYEIPEEPVILRPAVKMPAPKMGPNPPGQEKAKVSPPAESGKRSYPAKAPFAKIDFDGAAPEVEIVPAPFEEMRSIRRYGSYRHE